MIVKKRGKRWELIDNGKFVARGVSHAEALAILQGLGYSKLDAYELMFAETTWESYRAEWFKAVEHAAKQVEATS